MPPDVLPSSSKLTGPWWSHDSAYEATREYEPCETFFRLEFSESATSFALATGCFYQAWLNGNWLGYGPARASHGRLTIDRWALPAGQLREQNVITVQAFWEGIFTYDHVRGEPGIWLGLDGSDFTLWSSGRTGRRPTYRLSHQRGWAEEIDARKRAKGWPAGGWDEAEWQPAILRKMTASPPVILEERDLLPLVRVTRRAEWVSFAGSADLAGRVKHRQLGYEHTPGFDCPEDSAARNIQEERLLPSGALDRNLAALTVSGSGDAVLAPDPAGGDRTVQLDFGHFVTGLLVLELTAPAGTVVDIGWSEAPWQPELSSRWSESSQPAGAVTPRECNDARQGTRYTCAGGRERFEGLVIMAMRCVRLTFRTPQPEAITLHELSVRVSGYPIEREGAFLCSDASLNRIHRAAVETMENSIHDVYMDCPGRERGGWLNDSYSAAVGLGAISADTTLDRRFLRQFIDSLEHNRGTGTLFPLYPSEAFAWPGGYQRPIACHTLFWLLQVERHLRLFGDAELRQQWQAGVATVFEGLARYRTPEGLVENIPWDEFLDWSPMEAGPLRVWTNLIYGLALQRLGHLYGNAAWQESGEITLRVSETASWDEGRGLYSNSLRREEGRLVPEGPFSELVNYVALWAGVVPPDREKIVWRQLRNLHPRSTDRAPMPDDLTLARCNAYGLLYRAEIQGRRGEVAELARDLREAYLPMLDRGQTTLSEHYGYHYSLCHGFQGYIAHVLARYVGGIQLPENPGDVIQLRPTPDLLAWCQARVPWMGGHVQMWCARHDEKEAEVLISLPAGQRGELQIGFGPPVQFESTLQTRVRFRT